MNWRMERNSSSRQEQNGNNDHVALRHKKEEEERNQTKRDRVDGPIGIEEAASGCDVGVMGCELSWSP
jgi:hypothetical protein